MAKVRKPRKLKPIKKVKRLRKKKTYTKADITVSKVETKFKKFLQKDLKLQVEDQFQIAYKWFDFRVKDTKVLIELDGDYYHCNPAVYKEGAVNNMQRKNIENDRYKTALARSSGYTLIRIWEKDFKERPEDVKKRILDEINKYKVTQAAKEIV